jgi:hypothetical protein
MVSISSQLLEGLRGMCVESESLSAVTAKINVV